MTHWTGVMEWFRTYDGIPCCFLPCWFNVRIRGRIERAGCDLRNQGAADTTLIILPLLSVCAVYVCICRFIYFSLLVDWCHIAPDGRRGRTN